MDNKTYITISFNTEADRDILHWLKAQENRSAAVRDVIREHIEHRGVTLADVFRAVQEIDRKLGSGVVLAGAQDGTLAAEWDEPADVAAALEKLGRL